MSAEKVLLVTGSIRGEDAASTQLGRKLAARLAPQGFRTRDTAADVPMVDIARLVAMNTPAAERTLEQTELAAISDALIAELQEADTIVLAAPIYNFAPSAQLKSWFDHVARAGVTFRYTEAGAEGLLKGKKAYIAYAANGTEQGSAIDFATGWMKHMLGFIGIETVDVVAADRQALDETSLPRALEQVEKMEIAA